MNTETKAGAHTPTVSRYDYWALFSNERPLVGYESLRSDANIVGYRIGNDDNVLCDCKTEEQAKAICAAVNSHAALVEALKALTTHSEGTNAAFYGSGKTKDLIKAFDGQKALLQQARATLAAAEGGV